MVTVAVEVKWKQEVGVRYLFLHPSKKILSRRQPLSFIAPPVVVLTMVGLSLRNHLAGKTHFKKLLFQEAVYFQGEEWVAPE